MSSRMPSFLLGGINMTYNFLGSRTARTAGYGVIETGIKIAPIFMLFGMAAKSATGSNLSSVFENRAENVQTRRTSLAQ